MTPAQRDLYIRTIIGEAGGEGRLGQEAVAHVINNRLRSGRWGDNLNSVILSPKQFSLWNEGDPAGVMARNVPADSPRYQSIGQIVDGVFGGQIADPTRGALNYYNPRAASPDWGPGMTGVMDIGNHRFGTAAGAGGRPGPSEAPMMNSVAGGPPPATGAQAAGPSALSAPPPPNPYAGLAATLANLAQRMQQPTRQQEAPQSAPQALDIQTPQMRPSLPADTLVSSPLDQAPQTPMDEPYARAGMSGLLARRPQFPGRLA